MGKISEELIPKIYEVAKKVYTGSLSLTEGREILSHKYGMNYNSAADYINNFRCMMEGKEFTRTNNAASVDYTLENIFKDFGPSGYSDALNALIQHIEYYEGVQNITMHKMRKVYESHLNRPKIGTEDDREQEEIIQQEKIRNRSKEEILKDLRKIRQTDPEIITINGKSYKRDNRTIALIRAPSKRGQPK